MHQTATLIERQGGVQVEEPDVISFPDGLVGCEEWRDFVLLERPESAPLKLLQSVDDPDIAFIVADPYLICPDYRLELSAADLAAIQLTDLSQALILCILVVRQELMTVSANLLGPLVVNRQNRQARQVVLANSSYSPRHPVVAYMGSLSQSEG